MGTDQVAIQNSNLIPVFNGNSIPFLSGLIQTLHSLNSLFTFFQVHHDSSCVLQEGLIFIRLQEY